MHYHGRDYPCAAHDLSRSGVLLTGELPWPADREVDLTVRSVGGDLNLRIRGLVQRVSEDGAEHTQVGIEFGRIEEAQRSVLESLVSRVVEGLSPAFLEGLTPNAPEPEIRDALAKVPLAHRMALAARAMPREREILIKDSNPQVLEALARNPNLLTHEMRSLLRLAILLPSTLEILARDSRWMGDEEAKILIATHPRAPFTLSDRLLATVSPDGMRKALQRPGLNPSLRTKLLHKLTRQR
jgi:hypothetical protein